MGKYYVEYYDEEKTKIEWEFWENEEGKHHKENGPAFITYYKNGQKGYESWKINGKWHNLDGPAKLSYDENGEIINKQWYIDNKRIQYTDWLLHSKRIEYRVKQELKETE